MSAYVSLLSYRKALQEFKKSVAESESVQGIDSTTGVSATKGSTLAYIEQPFMQLTIKGKYALRTPNFDVNARAILSQSQSFVQQSNIITRVCDFEVTEAKALISHQAPSYLRLIDGQDLSSAKDSRSQASNRFVTSSYSFIEVSKSTTQDPLLGPTGRYDLIAHEAINLKSTTSHFVARCAKTFFSESKDFLVKAKSSASLSAGAAVSVSAGSALSLQGNAVASLSAKGSTIVSAIGPVFISGSVVNINMSGGGAAKAPVDLKLIQQLQNSLPTLAAKAVGVAAAVASGSGVSAIAGLASGLTGNALLDKAIESGVLLATEGPEAFKDFAISAATDFAVGELTNVLGDAGLPPELTDVIVSAAKSKGNVEATLASATSGAAGIAGRVVSQGIVDIAGRATPSTIAGLSSEFVQGKGGAASEQITNLFTDPVAFYDRAVETELADIASNSTREDEQVEEGEQETSSGAIPPPPVSQPVAPYVGPAPFPKIPVLEPGLSSSAPAAQEFLPEPA
jgi:hypothetical protein